MTSIAIKAIIISTADSMSMVLRGAMTSDLAILPTMVQFKSLSFTATIM